MCAFKDYLLFNALSFLFYKKKRVETSSRPATPVTSSINSSLMLEAHIMMKKDECPVLTLVLCNARVILAYDWLDDLKQFLNLYTDFVPKYSDEIPYHLTESGRRQTFSKTHDGAIIERNAHATDSASSHFPTFSFKITHRDSDLYLLENLIKNYKEAQKKSLIPINVPQPPSKPIDIAIYMIQTEHTDLWILDDLQSNSIPLLRLSVAHVCLKKTGERIIASFHVSMDYFNQRIFGWEPVIEEWKIHRFLHNKKDLKQTIEWVAETKSTLNINVTEQLI
nr:hypothetical protein R12C12.8 - Caenorhabditis elegans [Caenorhabditis elegans]